MGPDGELLDELLQEAGIPPEDVRVTNAVRCISWTDQTHTETRAPPADSFAACLPHLWEEIEHVRPDVIVPLGEVAIMAFLGSCKVSDVRGRMHSFPMGLSDGTTHEFKVFPTYHPAYVNRVREARGTFVLDLMRMLAELRGEQVLTALPGYRLLTKVSELEELAEYILAGWKAGTITHLGLDTETSSLEMFDPNSYLVSVQVAWAEGQAATIPLQHKNFTEHEFSTPQGYAEARRILRRLLTSRIPLVGQNLAFDFKFIWAKLGISLGNVVLDTMLANHALYGGSRPNGLEYLAASLLHWPPYKAAVKGALDKGGRIEDEPLDRFVAYANRDADATYRLYPILKGKLEECERSRVYARLYREPWRALRNMEIGGLDIDVDRLKWVAGQVESIMLDAERTVRESAYVAAWRETAREPNPKRWKRVNAKQKLVQVCSTCNGQSAPPPRKKGAAAPLKACGLCGSSTVKGKRVYVDEGQMIEQLDQPEFLYPEFNVGSNPQIKALLRVMYPAVEKLEDLDGYQQPDDDDDDEESTGHDRLVALGKAAMRGGNAEAGAVLREIVRYRWASKLLGSYVLKLPTQCAGARPRTRPRASFEPDCGVHRLHCNFLQHIVPTGRLSCRDPNLQNIPKYSLVRWAMIPHPFEVVRGGVLTQDPGIFISHDYSQQELRVFAALTRDEKLIAALSNGGDIHRQFAAMLNRIPIEQVTDNQRRRAKTVVFGMIYGRGPVAIAAETGITVTEAKALIAQFFEEFQGVAAWIADRHKQVQKKGYAFGPTGRYFHLPDGKLKTDYKLRSRALRQSVNYPVQGGASDVGSVSLAPVARAFEKRALQARLYAFVHDALDVQSPTHELFDVAAVMRAEMLADHGELFEWLKGVPLAVSGEIGTNLRNMLEISEISGDNGTLTLSGNQEFYPDLREQLAQAFTIVEEKIELGKTVSYATPEGFSDEEISGLPDYQKATIKLRLAPFAAA